MAQPPAQTDRDLASTSEARALARRAKAAAPALAELSQEQVDAIVDAVARARARAAYVFTSGGIGPTHDDVTVRAVRAQNSR